MTPFLYFNCECWVELPRKAVRILNQLQSSFFCQLFQVPQTCPIPAYLWDTCSLKPENYIILRKLLFLHHLATLPDQSLAKEVYLLQKEEKDLPGLVRECEGYLSELGMNSDPSSFTKRQWKLTIRDRINRKNKEEILQQVRSYKKLDFSKVSKEEYKVKKYRKF